ncbi:MAG: hypothetical protein ABH812_00670, partial [bacterium]
PQQIHTTFSRDRIGVVPPANTPRFGESPLERASRINSILDRARVKTQNPQEARPKEKGLFRQYASDVVDDLLFMANYVLPGSRKKAIALGASAAMLVAACGDTTTETTPPPTTSITIETTIPTTTLPPTTTEPTLPPSTTVPETTTTTIPPIPVEPTGEAIKIVEDENGVRVENIPIGTKLKETVAGPIKLIEWDGLVLDIYEVDENFGENAYPVTHLAVSIGSNNNEPIVIDVKLGRSVEVLSQVAYYSTSNLESSEITYIGNPLLSDVYNEVKRRVQYNSQVKFFFVYPNSPQEEINDGWFSFIQNAFAWCHEENPLITNENIKKYFTEYCEKEEVFYENADSLVKLYQVLTKQVEPDAEFIKLSFWMTDMGVYPVSNLDNRTPYDFDFSP